MPHSGLLGWLSSATLIHIQVIFGGHSGHIRDTFKRHSGDIRGKFRGYRYVYKVTLGLHSGYIEVTFTLHLAQIKVTVPHSDFLAWLSIATLIFSLAEQCHTHIL